MYWKQSWIQMLIGFSATHRISASVLSPHFNSFLSSPPILSVVCFSTRFPLFLLYCLPHSLFITSGVQLADIIQTTTKNDVINYLGRDYVIKLLCVFLCARTYLLLSECVCAHSCALYKMSTLFRWDWRASIQAIWMLNCWPTGVLPMQSEYEQIILKRKSLLLHNRQKWCIDTQIWKGSNCNIWDETTVWCLELHTQRTNTVFNDEK